MCSCAAPGPPKLQLRRKGLRRERAAGSVLLLAPFAFFFAAAASFGFGAFRPGTIIFVMWGFSSAAHYLVLAVMLAWFARSANSQHNARSG
jgi:hypothetical protein